MKIIVPTDFSNASKIALLYAANMAAQLNAEVTMLWFTTIHASEKTLPKWKKLEAEMMAVAEEDAAQLLEEISLLLKKPCPIVFKSCSGASFGASVNDFVTREKVDLIVMGTKGASGLKKALMGSNAATLVDQSSVPVIVVPEKAKFTSLKKIVYASDLYSLADEMKTMGRFASLYKAELHVIHVHPPKAKRKTDKNFVVELTKLAGYPNIVFKSIEHENVAEAIQDYLKETRADLLAMFTHKLGYYEKLFGRSVTRQVAFATKIPLLSFNKSLL